MSDNNLPTDMNIPTLAFKTANEILDENYRPRRPIIDGLLYEGVTLLAGDPKIGKSFMVMQLGYHVATGKPIWSRNVYQGEVLYLALEDSYGRIQHRLNRMFGTDDINGLNVAVKAFALDAGFGMALGQYFNEHPTTKLVIVDTLQKIKPSTSDQYSYSGDYSVITKLKFLAEICGLSILLVHHTRKMQSDNCFDRVSGTNGLMGAADATWILAKKDRFNNLAELNIVGRDQADTKITLELERQHCFWHHKQLQTALLEGLREPIVPAIIDIMLKTNNKTWSGSSSELLLLFPEEVRKDYVPNTLSRKLNCISEELFYNHKVLVKMKRTAEARQIIISYIDKKESNNDETS